MTAALRTRLIIAPIRVRPVTQCQAPTKYVEQPRCKIAERAALVHRHCPLFRLMQRKLLS